MHLKQIAWAAGILIVLAVIFGVWASYTKPIAPPVSSGDTSPVLGGTATTSGNYEYVEKGDGYQIDVIYPSHTPLQSSADLKARTALERGLQAAIADFKSNAEGSLSADEKARLKSMGTYYDLEMTYKPYQSTTTVSYEFDVYEDTGGAHPNGYFKTFVFDNAGAEVKLAGLFAPGSDYLARITKAATAQVTAQLKRGLGQADVSGDIFAEGLAPKDENFQDFVIDKDTLVILIPPYQVAAYVAGSFEIRIPLSQLDSILKPEFK